MWEFSKVLTIKILLNALFSCLSFKTCFKILQCANLIYLNQKTVILNLLSRGRLGTGTGTSPVPIKISGPVTQWCWASITVDLWKFWTLEYFDRLVFWPLALLTQNFFSPHKCWTPIKFNHLKVPTHLNNIIILKRCWPPKSFNP